MTAVLLAAGHQASAAIVSIDQVTTVPREDLLDVADVGSVSVLVQADLSASQALGKQSGLDQQSVIIRERGLDAGGLYAQVLQTATGARSLIVQSGSMNQAFVYQTVGAGSVSTIVQSGSGNTAFVRQ
ncbi:MAG: hypothetical protein Q8K11_15260 [Phenylobacterium sp.]|uniref:hypothetical protein n=1 Tax=Phenylobacterium sp. TaxID=1871053 RepID=UPI00272F3554|nr:hypothetical protein [Phenylobacterium sp.]MDP2011529.1 hypothetical protein [Phenylobacterium sp.]MDP3632685.1 hypothetical protein [Phenylobacterium sp.]MDZ4052005.1 hypothetical protein [Phenylobacterium sp.]